MDLYAIDVDTDQLEPQTWCGGNLGGSNETCMKTTRIPGIDAFIVGDTKPEGAGAQLRMTGEELDRFAFGWVAERGLTA